MEVDDGAMDGASLSRDEGDEVDAHAVQPASRFIATSERGQMSMALRNPTLQSDPVAQYAELLRAQSYRIDAHKRALKKSHVRVANAEQWCRAFGLAWMNPENLDSYATAASIAPDVLRDALSLDEGMRIGVTMEAQLQASGEAQQVLMAKSLPGLITAIEKSENMSEATALKLIDLFSKGRGSAKAPDPQPMIPPTVFTGTSAELIAEITEAGDEARALASRSIDMGPT